MGTMLAGRSAGRRAVGARADRPLRAGPPGPTMACMSEQPNPYRSAPKQSPGVPIKQVRIPHLHAKKAAGEKWAMLTAYDMYSAELFDEAGIPVLLVGDSAGNNVYGYPTTVPVTVDELIPLVRAVTRSVKKALVVADLPFGSYQVSPEQAYHTAVRFMKEGLAHTVKLEGGQEMAPQVEFLSQRGIPVMGHIGFTPQSEHALGGYRIQGRGEGADAVLADAIALEEAGAFAVVMEMVPTQVARRVTERLSIPTIGIGAGPYCDAQVLVWQDFAGMRGGRPNKFVKAYADLRGTLIDAARQFADEVATGEFPDADHSFEN